MNNVYNITSAKFVMFVQHVYGPLCRHNIYNSKVIWLSHQLNLHCFICT